MVTAAGEPVAGSPATAAAPGGANIQAGAVYDISHRLKVDELPADAASVRIWFWIPEDDVAQRTHSFTVADAPSDFLIVRDPATGSRFFYAELHRPGTDSIQIDTSFVVERLRYAVALDAGKCGTMSDAERSMLAEDLRTDTPNMEVTDEIRALADSICGAETNVVRQVEMLYAYVVDETDHYSKGENAPKSSGVGSAEYCIEKKGGGCTDQHALFIALARARDIPTRLSFGSRLQAKNEGKAVDPGYRCWVEYYVPSIGWAPMDCAAGDTVEGMRDFYRSGLDEQRIRFCHGRQLELAGAAHPVDYFIGAYVEVDGRTHTALSREMVFTRHQNP
jgi:transglutaminase-like putative cysteine protease